MFADHLRFLKEVVPNLASDQVFYEDKTEKESLKQVDRLNCNNNNTLFLRTGHIILN